MASKPKAVRLGAILQQMDAVWKEVLCTVKPSHPDNIDTLKPVFARLQEVLCTKEKCCKDLLNKYSNVLPQLLEILKFSCSVDQQMSTSILDSLNHICTPGKGMNLLLGAGIVQALSECVSLCVCNFLGPLQGCFNTEDLFVSLYTLLLKLANKDKRFSTISRICGGIHPSVTILKTYSGHGKIASMVVQVMKVYTSSVVNCGIMVKSGIVPLLLKMLNSCGQKKLQLLK
jgi:hypothetical protein